ncbi:4-aminobutyrate--2-oxoglutarate transaminase [Gynuella sunshinyii]|uniref:4-aminobutyrate aminotransferase and related aminotransferase n=1 Tax=Gynuella sunshinyii YC6258 TaxID=1445510 RepID=A0A0C5VDT5_9GAMM|nr:4-aminobutyrate--2-oxoglutarate transaminase [Gynuella sunshinyii]AJQ92366.1 4-aminobutyrate aminotransferase and related aminotransferase [Gynuella sunshinyii YC6258]
MNISTKTNASIQARRDKAFARGMGNVYSAFVAKAKNAEIWDVEGKRYIDFGSGIAVCNTGHSHPKIVSAVKQQVENFSHTCLMVNPYEHAVILAEKLNQLAPGQSEKKSILVNTGAEAVENAVKIARAHTGRRGVLAFTGGFHGRTNMTMALTGKVLPYKHSFGPFPGDIYHLPFPMNIHGVSVSDTIKALTKLTKASIAVEDIAAIIIEPIQGEGGFYHAPAELMQFLRNFCDEHGIVLIADEIQTGFARTGKLFCSEYYDIEPDLITMAKGIAGGYPLAAVVGKAAIMDAPMPGGLGGTYGGSPVACAAALVVLEVIEEEQLAARALTIGEIFGKRLEQIRAKYPALVGEIRIKGAMIAIEFVKNGDHDQPNTELTQQVVANAAAHHLILLSCGFYGNVIRFLPPLTISDDTIQEGMDYFDQLLAKITA